jgi:hypothetical protein
MRISWLILFSIPVLLIGCAYSSTITRYKTPDKIVLDRIAFVDLTSDSIPLEVYHRTNEIFCSTVSSTWKEVQKDTALYLKENINYFKTQSDSIAFLCKEQNVDGIIVSSIKFIRTDLYIVPVPVAIKNYDVEVSLKLFDKRGILLISNVFFSKDAGKSQQSLNKIELVIRDGTKGAVKGIIKEMKTEGYTYF